MSLYAAEERGRKEFGSVNGGYTIAQVAIGDDRWSMEFVVVSLEETTQAFTLIFYDGPGDLMSVPMVGLGERSDWADNVPPGGVRTMNTTNQGPLRQGYARLDANAESFALYAVLTSVDPSGSSPPFRTFVPGVRRLADQQRLFFNNTSFNVSCVAIASQVSVSSEEPIRIIARDKNGAEIQRTEFQNLDQGQHTAFCLPAVDVLPLTAGRLGVLDIIGTSAVIGFTFDSEGKMHTEMPYSVSGYDIDPYVGPPPPADPDPPPADPDPPPGDPPYDY